jgi:SAM-dependent methyltransferase
MIHFASYYRWLVAKKYWRLPEEFDGPLLDIGGDDGGFLSQLKAPYKVGLDLLHRQQTDLDWIQANGCYLPFNDNFFTDILAFDVIEHVEEDERLLREACRVLRPGGELWLSVPAHNFFLFPGGFIQDRFERSIGHVRRGYSAQMLENRLPPAMHAEVLHWNEPAFRFFYVALYSLKRLSPRLATTLVALIPRVDSLFRNGEAGHLFAHITKSIHERAD